MNTHRPNPQQRRTMETAAKAKPKPPENTHDGSTHEVSKVERSKAPEGGYNSTLHKSDGTSEDVHHATLEESHAHEKQAFGEPDGDEGGRGGDCY